ncbi:hypothetical protein PE066_18950 [Ramlibacter tataouinensis]|uniref:hypothetical protein n=1 Tax=Ramlibacter tataouinensis TaxID=94132 RepID=UPI0022F3C6E0|nr:hypothetical protein [Ramlibacter tataouinensis]WBY01518.1 hypothetical protein PE066_18950 [Ramlibacter tataouinensis]
MPPYQLTLSEFLAARQSDLRLSDEDLARLAGLETPKIWPLILNGKAKLPLQRIEGVAYALEVEAGALLEMALKEYLPDLLEVLTRAWGPRLVAIERDVIGHLRHVAAGGNRIVSVIVNGVPMDQEGRYA